jgi:hypothetical protein
MLGVEEVGVKVKNRAPRFARSSVFPEFAASPTCNAHALRNVSHEASAYKKTYTSKNS